jgi:hypothetical protein
MNMYCNSLLHLINLELKLVQGIYVREKQNIKEMHCFLLNWPSYTG